MTSNRANASRYGAHMNGKEGDHPVTDVTIYGLPAFNPEIDQLIIELKELGAWESEIASLFVLGEQEEYRGLAKEDQRSADALLSNLAWVLRAERDRLLEKRT
jgi:DNA invertase Pin-like site-specific DNA recombinase